MQLMIYTISHCLHTCRYMSDRNRYEAEFDIWSTDGFLPYDKIKEFLGRCDLHPSTSEIVMVLQKIGQRGYQDINKEKTIEMLFHIRNDLLKKQFMNDHLVKDDSFNDSTDLQRCLDLLKMSKMSKMNHIPSANFK